MSCDYHHLGVHSHTEAPCPWGRMVSAHGECLCLSHDPPLQVIPLTPKALRFETTCVLML